LYISSPTDFINIEKSDEFKWLFYMDKPLSTPIEFYPNHFVEGRLGANHIFTILKRISERMNYPAENISFSLKNGIQ